MKFFLIVVLFSCSTFAQKEKLSIRKVAPTKISTLHYFPMPGEITFVSALNYNQLDVTANQSGAKVMSYQTKRTDLLAGLGIGLFDWMQLRFTWGYLLGSETSISYPPNNPSTQSTGPAEPKIAAVVRLLDGESVKLNFTADFQPKIGNQKTATSTQEGNGLSGGNQFGATADLIILISPATQLEVSAKYKYFDLAIAEETGGESEEAAHAEITFAAELQGEVTTDLFFNVNLNLVKVDGYDSTEMPSLVVTEYGETTATIIGVKTMYETTPNNSFGLGVNYFSTYEGDVGTITASADGSFGVALGYQHRF